MTSSSPDASVDVSRSNGVTKVEFTRRMIVRGLVGGVLGLAHLLGHVLVVDVRAEHLGEEAEPVTRWLAASVKRSQKTSRSDGTQTHGELLGSRKRTGSC